MQHHTILHSEPDERVPNESSRTETMFSRLQTDNFRQPSILPTKSISSKTREALRVKEPRHALQVSSQISTSPSLGWLGVHVNTSSNSRGNEFSPRFENARDGESWTRKASRCRGKESRARVPSGCVMLKASEAECYEWG